MKWDHFPSRLYKILQSRIDLFALASLCPEKGWAFIADLLKAHYVNSKRTYAWNCPAWFSGENSKSNKKVIQTWANAEMSVVLCLKALKQIAVISLCFAAPSIVPPRFTCICTVIPGTWGKDIRREWRTLAKYVKYAFGLILFRATEL